MSTITAKEKNIHVNCKCIKNKTTVPLQETWIRGAKKIVKIKISQKYKNKIFAFSGNHFLFNTHAHKLKKNVVYRVFYSKKKILEFDPDPKHWI